MKISKKLLILLLIICLGQLVKANNGENGEKKSIEASVQGYVIDAITGKPVTGVTVSVSSAMVCPNFFKRVALVCSRVSFLPQSNQFCTL